MATPPQREQMSDLVVRKLNLHEGIKDSGIDFILLESGLYIALHSRGSSQDSFDRFLEKDGDDKAHIFYADRRNYWRGVDYANRQSLKENGYLSQQIELMRSLSRIELAALDRTGSLTYYHPAIPGRRKASLAIYDMDKVPQSACELEGLRVPHKVIVSAGSEPISQEFFNRNNASVLK